MASLRSSFRVNDSAASFGAPISLLGRARLLYVMPIIAAEVLCQSLTTPSLPFLFANDPFLSKRSAPLVFGSTDFVGCIFAFIVAPYIGQKSDSGRRPAFAILALILAMSYMTLMLCDMFSFTVLIWLPLRALSRLTMLALTYSYVADVTPDQTQIGRRFSLITATLMCSLLTGSILASFFTQQGTFIAAATIATSMLLYVVFLLPESVSSHVNSNLKEDGELRHPNVTESFLHKLTAPLRHMWGSAQLLRPIAIALLLDQSAEFGLLEAGSMYLNYFCNVTHDELARLTATNGAVGIIVQLVLLPLLLKRFSDRYLLMFAITMHIFQACAYMHFTDHARIYVIGAFQALAHMDLTLFSTLVSRSTPSNEQGVALGGIYGVKNLSQGVGPLFLSSLLTLFSQTYPEMPFWGAVFLFVSSMLVFFRFVKSPQARYAAMTGDDTPSLSGVELPSKELPADIESADGTEMT